MARLSDAEKEARREARRAGRIWWQIIIVLLTFAMITLSLFFGLYQDRRWSPLEFKTRHSISIDMDWLREVTHHGG